MSHPDSITVTGTGTATAIPDIALLHVGAEVRSPSLQDAFSGASQASEALVAAAVGAGVAREDIASTSLSVVPETVWNDGRGPQTVGYAASRGLTVTARDVSGTGDLLGALVAAAGDALRINGLALALSDPARPQASAQEAAFLDARASAERLAVMAGRRLGAVLAIDAGHRPGTPQPVPLQRVAMASAAGAVEPGTAETSASVTVTWALEDLDSE